MVPRRMPRVCWGVGLVRGFSRRVMGTVCVGRRIVCVGISVVGLVWGRVLWGWGVWRVRLRGVLCLGVALCFG